MKKENDVIQLFTYAKLQGKRPMQTVNFEHPDGNSYDACLHATGGYFQLDVARAGQKSKPTPEDRRKTWVKQGMKNQENKDCGWKFHITIAQDSANIQKAWDILLSIALQHKVGAFKIVQPGLEPVDNKVFTVYTFRGGPPLDKWDSFLKDVESEFRL